MKVFNNSRIIIYLLSIKVLVADKSAQDIDFISKAIIADHKFKVIAKARSGLDIISYSNKTKIDVIVMTTRLEMQTDKILKRLMERKPTAVLILQDTYDTEQYGQNYDYGLVDKILVNFNKGGIVINTASMNTRIQLLSKVNVKDVSQIKKASGVQSRRKLRDLIGRSAKKITPSKLVAPIPKDKKIIIIGASTGGPRLLSKLIPHMPINLPPVIIVQHIPVGFIEGFARRMANVSRIKVKMAREGEILSPGTVYIAPGGKHLKLGSRGSMMPRIELDDGPAVNFVKPSVDVTLFSAIEIWDKDVISVILTGMGQDGLEGSKLLKKKGGRIIALNKEDADIYGMNRAVIEAGIVDKILPANEVVKGIIETLRGR